MTGSCGPRPGLGRPPDHRAGRLEGSDRQRLPLLLIKFPCSSEKNSLIRICKFPVPLRREFGWKPIEFTHALNARIDAENQIQRNSLLISLLAGKFAAETGSQMTASS